MKVAFTTSTGVNVDEDFGTSTSFSIWDISPAEAYYVTSTAIQDQSTCKDDRMRVRAETLVGCTLVCTMGVNGPAAAKLAARNVQPIKVKKGTRVEAMIDKLQRMLRGTPPPWIAKSMSMEYAAPPVAPYENDRADNCAEVTVADFLGRYPETAGIPMQAGVPVFADQDALSSGGVQLGSRKR